MSTWQCVKQCGACCNLDPSDRPDLAEYLLPEQLAIYMSMVGEDGWCINLDQETRSCNIYDARPSFCRVQEDTFVAMFGIEPADLNDFAIACCREQIEGVYGERSLEAIRFDQELGILL